MLNELLRELCWRAGLYRLHDLHALLEESHLFFFHLIKDGNAAGRVDEFLTVHAVEESLDCIALLQFVELNDSLFPNGIQVFELRLV